MDMNQLVPGLKVCYVWPDYACVALNVHTL